MFKKFLATVSVMCLVVAASAGTIEVSLAAVDTSDAAGLTDIAVDPAAWAAAGYVVYDLVVTVAGDDRWTTAFGEADLTGGAFWEHPEGGNLGEPPSAYFQLTKYDSFWTSSEEFPNTDIDPSKQATVFAPGSPILMDATNRDAEWYADPEEPNVGDGAYTIARYTFLPSRAWELCVAGNVYLASTGGLEYPYDVCVPEPGSLGLLALGALGLIRRR